MDIPPCIQTIVRDIKSKKDVSSQDRYIITTYLINIGKSDISIKNLMVSLPDYNATMFDHQLKELRKSKYDVPTCEKIMNTTDRCTPNSDCIEVIDPTDL